MNARLIARWMQPHKLLLFDLHNLPIAPICYQDKCHCSRKGFLNTPSVFQCFDNTQRESLSGHSKLFTAPPKQHPS